MFWHDTSQQLLDTLLFHIADAPNNTPDNPAVKKSLTAMLTSYVTKKLVKESPHEVSYSNEHNDKYSNFSRPMNLRSWFFKEAVQS